MHDQRPVRSDATASPTARPVPSAARRRLDWWLLVATIVLVGLGCLIGAALGEWTSVIIGLALVGTVALLRRVRLPGDST